MNRSQRKYACYLIALLVGGYFFSILLSKSNQINSTDIRIDLILDTNKLEGSVVSKNTNGNDNNVNHMNSIIDGETIKALTRLGKKQKPQVCKIPVLNPFHPDITKFGEYSPKKAHCTYKLFSDVTDDGVLVIKGDVKNEVKTAQFAYIVRVTRDLERLTEMMVFFDDNKRGNL